MRLGQSAPIKKSSRAKTQRIRKRYIKEPGPPYTTSGDGDWKLLPNGREKLVIWGGGKKKKRVRLIGRTREKGKKRGAHLSD